MGKAAKGPKIPFLDFGGVQPGNMRSTYAYHEGQEAYDLYMGGRYVQDLIAWKEGRLDDLFHPEEVRDQNRRYAALQAAKETRLTTGSNPLSYFEVGSSCMGVIEALEHLNQDEKNIFPEQTRFYGVDNSTFMNGVAKYAHPNHDVQVWQDVHDVQPIPEHDVFFAKGVSLMYAFDEPELLADFIKKSRIAVFDYTFSKTKETQEMTINTGIPVYFLPREEVENRLNDGKRSIHSYPYQVKDYKHDPSQKETVELVIGLSDVVSRYFDILERRTGENQENYGSTQFVRDDYKDFS